MPGPTNENADANPPAGETPESATPAPAAATAPQPAAAATAPVAPPRQHWYRRRWAVITGAVAAAVVLFLGGMAVGTTIGDHGRGDLRGERGPGMLGPGEGQGFGHEAWGDGGQRMPPGMGQGGQGWGHDDRDRDGDGPHDWQSPDATPAPSTTPQAQ
jgi:hypothetical protein